MSCRRGRDAWANCDSYDSARRGRAPYDEEYYPLKRPLKSIRNSLEAEHNHARANWPYNPHRRHAEPDHGDAVQPLLNDYKEQYFYEPDYKQQSYNSGTSETYPHPLNGQHDHEFATCQKREHVHDEGRRRYYAEDNKRSRHQEFRSLVETQHFPVYHANNQLTERRIFDYGHSTKKEEEALVRFKQGRQTQKLAFFDLSDNYNEESMEIEIQEENSQSAPVANPSSSCNSVASNDFQERMEASVPEKTKFKNLLPAADNNQVRFYESMPSRQNFLGGSHTQDRHDLDETSQRQDPMKSESTLVSFLSSIGSILPSLSTEDMSNLLSIMARVTPKLADKTESKTTCQEQQDHVINTVGMYSQGDQNKKQEEMKSSQPRCVAFPLVDKHKSLTKGILKRTSASDSVETSQAKLTKLWDDEDDDDYEANLEQLYWCHCKLCNVDFKTETSYITHEKGLLHVQKTALKVLEPRQEEKEGIHDVVILTVVSFLVSYFYHYSV